MLPDEHAHSLTALAHESRQHFQQSFENLEVEITSTRCVVLTLKSKLDAMLLEEGPEAERRLAYHLELKARHCSLSCCFDSQHRTRTGAKIPGLPFDSHAIGNDAVPVGSAHVSAWHPLLRICHPAAWAVYQLH